MATSGTEVINYRVRARTHAQLARSQTAGSAFRNFDPKIAAECGLAAGAGMALGELICVKFRLDLF